MKIAVIGSRKLTVENLGDYLPTGTTEIVSGGASGIDTCAREYAQKNGLILKEFLPDYRRYKKGATLRRNLEIIEYADSVIAFWDGKSKGTKFVIDACAKAKKEVNVIMLQDRGTGKPSAPKKAPQNGCIV